MPSRLATALSNSCTMHSSDQNRTRHFTIDNRCPRRVDNLVYPKQLRDCTAPDCLLFKRQFNQEVVEPISNNCCTRTSPPDRFLTINLMNGSRLNRSQPLAAGQRKAKIPAVRIAITTPSNNSMAIFRLNQNTWGKWAAQ